jgi:hypothetical protein
VHHVVEGVEAAEARGADDVGAFGEAGGLGEPFGDGGPAVRYAPACHGLAELFGEVVVGEEDAAGEAGAVLHPAVGVLVGVLEGEGAQGIDRSRRASTKSAAAPGISGT